MAREADLRYQPQVKDLKDVMCFSADKEVLIKILDRLIAQNGDSED